MKDNVDEAEESMDSLVDSFFDLLVRKKLQGGIKEIAEELAAPRIEGVCTVGMGGSSIVGQIGIALLQDSSPVPLTFVRDYQLPMFVDEKWAVICVSYSGTTEETLSAYKTADARGCELFSITTGRKLGSISDPRRTHILPKGIQPRAALPMILAAVFPLMQCLLGQEPVNLDPLVKKLKVNRKRMLRRLRKPEELAKIIDNKMPAFIGWRHLVPIAYRAKTQINENAKAPAYSLELPEANHNEIEAVSAYTSQSILPILLRSRYEDSQTESRFQATAKILRGEGINVETIRANGNSKLEEALLIIQYLDEVSVKLAHIRGVNPMTVPQISLLKDILGGKR